MYRSLRRGDNQVNVYAFAEVLRLNSSKRCKIVYNSSADEEWPSVYMSEYLQQDLRDRARCSSHVNSVEFNKPCPPQGVMSTAIPSTFFSYCSENPRHVSPQGHFHQYKSNNV